MKEIKPVIQQAEEWWDNLPPSEKKKVNADDPNEFWGNIANQDKVRIYQQFDSIWGVPKKHPAIREPDIQIDDDTDTNIWWNKLNKGQKTQIYGGTYPALNKWWSMIGHQEQVSVMEKYEPVYQVNVEPEEVPKEVSIGEAAKVAREASKEEAIATGTHTVTETPPPKIEPKVKVKTKPEPKPKNMPPFQDMKMPELRPWSKKFNIEKPGNKKDPLVKKIVAAWKKKNG